MCQIEIGREIFLRTAGRSYIDFKYHDLEHCLKDAFFQTAVFFSSRSLFEELQKNNFEYQSLSEKVRITFKKYYNRFCYRATPFGLWASVSVCTWEEGAASLILAPGQTLAWKPETAYLWRYARSVHDSSDWAKLVLNPTINKIKFEYRFIRADISSDLKVSFHFSSISCDSLIKGLFSYCNQPRSEVEIRNFCEPYHADADKYVSQLLEAGIFYSLICPDYQRENTLLSVLNRQNSIPQKIGFSAGERRIIPERRDEIKQLANDFIDPEINPAGGSCYINSSVDVQSGLPDIYRGILDRTILCLEKLAGDSAPPGLREFKTKFKAKFDQRCVPLLTALDPEIGLDYLGLAASLSQEAGDLSDLKTQKRDETVNWGPVQRLFADKFIGASPGYPVSITDLDLQQLPQNDSQSLPPSFSASFSVHDKNLVMNHVGGVSAYSLAGRFTVFNDNLNQYGSQIVSREKLSNPDVIFAEIICLTDGNVADLNARITHYDYQIPLFMNFIAGPELILPSDIMIQVVGSEILISSFRLKKRIIPRFSSAYNYNRHPLPLFRFLCDLQHQSLKSNLTLSLEAFFPGMRFYPRVVYGRSILSRETWILNKSELISSGSIPEKIKFLREGLLKNAVPKKFQVSEQDHHLIFNLFSDEDLAVCLTLLQTGEKLVVKETFDAAPVVLDSELRPLAHEIIAPVFNLKNIYRPIPGRDTQSARDRAVKRLFLPSEEWIYYKIYSSPLSSDMLLSNQIARLIRRLKKENLLSHWFFIRYQDPDNHLRLRIRLNGNCGAEVQRLVNDVFQNEVSSGIVARILIDSYERELERYGFNSIDEAEHMFWMCSVLSLKSIKARFRGSNTLTVVEELLIAIDSLISAFTSDDLVKEKIAGSIAEGIGRELDLSRPNLHRLDEKYRVLKPFLYDSSYAAAKKQFKENSEFRNFISSYKMLDRGAVSAGEDKRISILRDIIHMHVNRMVNEEPRTREYTIAYFLEKHYHSIRRKKQSGLPSADN